MRDLRVHSILEGTNEIMRVIIARELECRIIETVSVITYDEEQRGQPRIAKTPAAAGDGTGWLLGIEPSYADYVAAHLRQIA